MNEITEKIHFIIKDFIWDCLSNKFICLHNSETVRQYNPSLLRTAWELLMPKRELYSKHVIYTGYDTFEEMMILKDHSFGEMEWQGTKVSTFRGIPIIVSNTVTKTSPSILSDIYFIDLENYKTQHNMAKICDLGPALSPDKENDLLLLLSYRLDAIYVANNLLKSTIGITPTYTEINHALQQARILLERNGIEMDW